ncbi:MAG TPA: ABC transporter substrate-binding protein [Chloroflexota bacterium]|nr:ABC transporter substrate-binding protein [Chloroflexota bacterium]
MRLSLRSLLLLAAAWVAAACTAPARPTAPSGAPPAAPPAATGPAPTAGGPSAPAPSGAASAPQPLQPPQPVRIASIGLAAQAPTYLAIEQGYFTELGLLPEVVPLTTTADVVAMLSGDQLDVGFGAINPAVFNAVARGVGIRIVADHGSNIPGRSTPSLAVRTDILERRPWTGYHDLRGLKVAVQQLGTLTEYYLELMLQRGGVSRSEVEIVGLPFPDMAVAFANKAIDAAIYNEPWATQQEQQGIIKKIVYTDDVDPNGHVAVLLYSETFARNTQAARNYMVGYLRGVRDYWDAYDGRRDFQIVIDVLQKYTQLKDEALLRKIPPTGQNPAGYLDPAKLAAYQDWFAERGLITRKIDIAQALDCSFLDYANAVLGPYQPVAQPRRPE